MSFRRRLLLFFALTVLVSVAAVALIVSLMARQAFDRSNDERAAALLAQFRREFNRRGEEVARRIVAASATPEAVRITLAAAQNSPNYNAFLDDAQVVAETQRLDFLEFCDDHGTIISSAQWPAKFGYQDLLVNESPPKAPFLKIEETPSGSTLGLFAVHEAAAGDHRLFVIGGVKLDSTFLSTLDPPPGMRVMLYQNLETGKAEFSSVQLVTAASAPEDASQLAPLIARVQDHGSEASEIIHWKSGHDETVSAFPLLGDKKQVLGILLVGSSREIYTQLRGQIRSAALLAAGAGLLLASILAGWAAARVTRPIEQLAGAAHEVATGNWDASVSVASQDELGELAASFNSMTSQLQEQRQRLMQAERVAAWRELARRLAHELKNPLFPLQLTVENLLRARDSGGQEFDETFRESSATLLSEITNLKNIVGRFSEFSKMPQPQFQLVALNEVIEEAIKLHQAQLDRAGVTCRCELNGPQTIAADRDLVHRALSNLIMNAIDAMLRGGILTVSTRSEAGSAIIEIADTGTGLTVEERSQLFTPYYTNKPQGTGLGLAIVQSIVSDHGGRISVSSEPGAGTTFKIQLPTNLEKFSSAQETHA
jgi:two-component system, NtrC family, nitrogen regulation sensor histidine kinase NtrY